MGLLDENSIPRYDYLSFWEFLRGARDKSQGKAVFVIWTRGALPAAREQKPDEALVMLSSPYFPSAIQVRRARAGIFWTQAMLAGRAGVCARTIRHIEVGTTAPFKSTLAKIIAAFKAEGVNFNNDGSVIIHGDAPSPISPHYSSDPVRAERIAMHASEL